MKKKRTNYIHLNEYELERNWRKVNYKELDELGIKIVCLIFKKKQPKGGTLMSAKLKIVSKGYTPKQGEFVRNRIPIDYYIRKKGNLFDLVPKKMFKKVWRFRL